MVVDFHYDFSSPFAYLASTQVEGLARRTGCELRWRPLLLGGLFRDLGGVDVPLLAMPPAKRALVETDLERWAAWWGVPLRWPERFPLRTVLPLRCVLAHARNAPHEATVSLAGRIFHAAWGEGRDIGDPDVLGDLGVSRTVLEAAPNERETLRTANELARARGIFGVPTFDVDGRWLVWGQDRLPMVEAMVRGDFRPVR
jgi:2-hydroxychromene-2-carboxylate isomerase